MELKFALNILYERRNTKDVTILLPLPPGGALPVIAEDRRRVDAILARMKRRDFLSPLAQDADQMTERAGKRLFMAVESNQNNMLHNRPPYKGPEAYSLRPRAHDYFSSHLLVTLRTPLNSLLREAYTTIHIT